VDFLIWAAVAMSVQLIFAFVIIRLNAKFSFEKQIENGVISVSVLMAFLSVSIGLLNAGSMSY
jgi:putative membrane protein